MLVLFGFYHSSCWVRDKALVVCRSVCLSLVQSRDRRGLYQMNGGGSAVHDQRLQFLVRVLQAVQLLVQPGSGAGPRFRPVHRGLILAGEKLLSSQRGRRYAVATVCQIFPNFGPIPEQQFVFGRLDRTRVP
uniref:(northern house mosquito) hypothetical protein n=1 Tax=Culex pipiens TaxID=7175 RepID=A0A8D8JL26_CULPI